LGATDLGGLTTAAGGAPGALPRPFLVGWRPTSDDPRIASVRIRCLNPLGELRRQGYPVELYKAARRGSYAAVIFSKVYDEAIQAEAEKLRAAGAWVVLDLCDNHFYDAPGAEVARTASARLRRMLGLADELVASTEAMAEVLREETGGRTAVTVIGDAVETTIEGVWIAPWERWLAQRRLRALSERLGGGSASRLVWFGSHGGPSGDHGIGDLETLRPLLESLHSERPVSLTVISNSAEKFERLIRPWRLPTHYLEWSPVTFLAALRLHEIAVIPIRDNPFTRCKTNNRLVTALASGLAVVASSIPSYLPFASACTLDDWSGGLRRYIFDPASRRRAVAAGQAVVDREWLLPVIADQWRRYFDGFRERAPRR
jgi:hypothetical protein